MNRNHLVLAGILIVVIAVGLLISASQVPPLDDNDTSQFPDFITRNEDYFTTRIGNVPIIDRDTYRLEIKGLVDNPTSFTLEELQALTLTDLPLTVECIGNNIDGKLLGTAVWRGFNIFDLLTSLDISQGATGVKYLAADGYFASHTLEQVENNGVLGALYMNGVEIPAVQGFPLRILNPGYYGVKQPAWVTEIEVIDTPLQDYWDLAGWDTSPPMEIDSKIFFPDLSVTISRGENLHVGGCAFGGTRVKLVEYTITDGLTWENATIVQQMDADNVWVFWEINTVFYEVSEFTLYIRAADIYDNQQIRTDSSWLNGTSSWPQLIVYVTP